MTIFRRNRLSLFAACALLSACNLTPGGGDDDDDDDDAGDDDDDAGGDPIATTIQALNAGDHDVGTLVSVEGAIVTAVYLLDDDFVTFWVQDDLGGPGGGIAISLFADVLEEFDPKEALYLGDIVDITGSFQLAFDLEVPRIRVDQGSNLAITGYTDLPDAHLVEAEEIEGGFADRSLWGLSVGVEDVTVETLPSFESFGEFEADGILVDDAFYWPDVAIDDELVWLAGIVTPQYGEATLLPRWDDDVWFEPAGCDAVPKSDDDDLQQVNCRRYYEGETVSIDGLTVISGEVRSGNYFVQDLANPTFGGVLLYDPTEDATVPAVGAVLDLAEVEYSEYDGQSELAAWDGTITDTGETNEIVATEVADPCSLTEAHESTLVAIPSVTLSEPTDWEGRNGYYPVDGCREILVGGAFFDDAEAFNAVNGGVGTITNLVGVVSDRQEHLFINPRSTDDWETWTSADE